MSKPRSRQEARDKIVQAANRHRLKRAGRTLPLFGPRQLQRCVKVCRAHRLVKPEVLVAAGYNPTGPDHRPGRPQ